MSAPKGPGWIVRLSGGVELVASKNTSEQSDVCNNCYADLARAAGDEEGVVCTEALSQAIVQHHRGCVLTRKKGQHDGDPVIFLPHNNIATEIYLKWKLLYDK